MSIITPKSTPRLKLPYEGIAQFCRRWGIARLELFGSALRDDFGPESDMDFLYVLAPGVQIGWEFSTLCDELEAIVGRPIDMVSRTAVERSVNPRRKNEILGSAQVIYAE
ncbi:MAG: nucleotidyltransferase domain-containing protein [Pirellulales bacterium]